jgi:hypothetical protein
MTHRRDSVCDNMTGLLGFGGGNGSSSPSLPDVMPPDLSMKYVCLVVRRFVENSVFIFCTIARKRRTALVDCGVKLVSESYLKKDPSYCSLAAALYTS